MSSTVRSASTENLRSKRKVVHSQPQAPPAKQAKTVLTDITNKNRATVTPSCARRDPSHLSDGKEASDAWEEDLHDEEPKKDERTNKENGLTSDFEFADRVAASSKSNRRFDLVVDPTQRVYIHGEVPGNVVVGLEVNNLCCSETISDAIEEEEEEEQQQREERERRQQQQLVEPNHFRENQSSVQSGNTHSIKFGVLPEEILLIIFKKLPYNWTQLLQLRLVCKQWSRLLVDRSLKYGELSEELRTMVENERKHQSKIRDYLANNRHPDVTPQRRIILVDWLVEVAQEFNLSDETLFLCIHLIDRYLSQLSPEFAVTKGKIQLLGIAAMLTASKYEEVFVPLISDLVYITENTYTKQEIIAMEISLLNVVRFDLSVQTSKHFVQYFLKSVETSIQCPSFRDNLHNLSHYFVELILPEYQFIRYLPSMIGAAVVCLALLTLGLRWNYVMEYKSLYSWDELHNCVREIYEVLEQTPKEASNAVYLKYQQSKYNSISTYPIIDELQQHSFL